MNIFAETIKESPAVRRPPTLVIGWGSELRGDDGAGRWVARALADHPREEVESLSVHQLTPELSAHISGVRQVIFVDASPSPTVRVSAIHATAADGPRTHSGSPESLLHLASWLYDAHPSAWLVGIPAESFEIGQGFSSRTESAVREALCAVEKLIAQCKE